MIKCPVVNSLVLETKLIQHCKQCGYNLLGENFCSIQPRFSTALYTLNLKWNNIRCSTGNHVWLYCTHLTEMKMFYCLVNGFRNTSYWQRFFTTGKQLRMKGLIHNRKTNKNNLFMIPFAVLDLVNIFFCNCATSFSLFSAGPEHDQLSSISTCFVSTQVFL